MKASFNKTLAAAGIAAALSGVSVNSMAAVSGDAGEAWLVPFAYFTNGPAAATVWDTVVNVTIPSTVGGKTIPNIYTANNTTPRGQVTNPPTVSLPQDQTPFEVFLQPAVIATHWSIHYYFQSFQSGDRCDSTRPITPEDWNSYRLSELCPGNPNEPGYLVFTTAAGAAGGTADFAFFADAMLTGDNTGDTAVLPPADHVAWHLPTLAMPDGADAQGISEHNQVMETTTPMQVIPITAGIGTFAPPGSRKVIDLSLGDRSDVEGAYALDTLLVIWNSDNLTNRLPPFNPPVHWDGVTVQYFNDDEFACSTSIPLPWELNLIWFTTTGAADPDTGAGAPPFIAGHIDTGEQVGGVSRPARLWTPDPCGGADAIDAFVRMQLPVVRDGTTFADRTAMYGVSLMMWWNGAFAYPASYDPAPEETEATRLDTPMPSVDAHDRGLFQTFGNAFPQ